MRLLRSRRLLLCASSLSSDTNAPPAPHDRAVCSEHCAQPGLRDASASSLQRISAMSLSASRRGHHTAMSLDAIALVCLILRTRLAAEERRVLRLPDLNALCPLTLWLGLTYYHTCKACAAAPSAVRLVRRYSSRTPAQHARATRRAADQAARTRGGARARRSEASGGSVRLAAARGGERVRAPECSLVPGSVRCRGAQVGWRSQCSGRALSQRATGPRSGRGATLTAQRQVAHVECSGSAAASGPGSESSIKRSALSAGSLGTCSDPPSRTLSVERGSNHF